MKINYSTLCLFTLLLICADYSAPSMKSARAGSARSYCQSATQPAAEIRTLRCDSHVSFRYVDGGIEGTNILKSASDVDLTLNYVVRPPSEIKITLVSYTAPNLPSTNIFSGQAGLSMLLSPQSITMTFPDGRVITNKIDQPVEQSIPLPKQFDLPFIAGLITDSLKHNRAAWKTAKRLGEKKIDGRTMQIMELRHDKPVMSAWPHHISTVRRAINPDNGLVVQEEGVDSRGRVVITSKFEKFQKNLDGKWVFLRKSTTITPGIVSLTLPTGSESAAPSVPLQGRVLIKGRSITHEYSLHENKYPLLRAVDIEDEDGSKVMHADFSNYKVNEN